MNIIRREYLQIVGTSARIHDGNNYTKIILLLYICMHGLNAKAIVIFKFRIYISTNIKAV
jgi:hypothetical protein